MQPRGADLLAVALPLRPLRSGAAPRGLGAPAHGLLFSLLKQAVPRAGDTLHAGLLERQPFTASPILETPEGPPAELLHADRVYWLRLSFLMAPMVQLWEERLAPALPHALCLGSEDGSASTPRATEFELDLKMGPAQARATTYARLAAARPAGRWLLRFLTPTTFQPALAPDERAGAPRTRTLPLPVPELILRGLGRGWCAFAPPEFQALAAPEEVERLARHVQLDAPPHESAAGIAITRVWLDSPRAAFTGSVALMYLPGRGDERAGDERRLRLLTALLLYATFAGIGIQTARGMGIVTVRSR